MQPDYEMVMETSSLAWTMIPVLLHGLSLVAQLLLAVYLLLHGLALAVKPDGGSPLLARLGALRPEEIDARAFGLVELAAGALVLLPLSLGASWLISGAACVVVLGGLLAYGRRHPRGRLVQARSRDREIPGHGGRARGLDGKECHEP